MAILGALLVTIILIISGSVVAPWHYAVSISYYNNVTNRSDILGAPDDVPASLGIDGPPPELGEILLDLGSGNEMGSSQDFTVFANSSSSEIYNVSICESEEDDAFYLGWGEDTTDYNFTTPSTPGKSWRYIKIRGYTGTGGGTGDHAYGPDIDAIGWI